MAKTTKNPQADGSPMQKWADDFAIMRPTYVQFARKLQELISEFLQLHGIDYHAMECRAKSQESFFEKIQRPGKRYKDPLKELPDLAGLRIIAYYPDDIVRIREILREEFSIDPLQSADKAAELAADQFGYLSVHEVVTLTSKRRAMTEWARYEALHAEIQIRTVLQHAWASISHKLQYKHEADIPRPLRRKLLRLSGLLELADEQFSELRRERSELASQVFESINEKNLAVAVDSDSVMTYMAEAEVVREVESIVKSIGFPPVPDDYESQGLSQVVTLCQQLSIETLADLDHTLQQVRDKLGVFFGTFAENHVGASGNTPHWLAVILAGFDQGKSLQATDIPWSDKYTADAFNAGVTAFGSKGKRKTNKAIGSVKK